MPKSLLKLFIAGMVLPITFLAAERTWTRASDGKTVRGELVDVDLVKQVVTIERGGRMLKSPLSLFVKGDQQFIQEFARRQAENFGPQEQSPEDLATEGFAYLKGEGVPRNAKRAEELLRRAAELGHAYAAYELGMGYTYGRFGGKDEKVAARWFAMSIPGFKKEAERGDFGAQAHLRTIYYKGQGVAKDFEIAYAWALIMESTGEFATKEAASFLESQMTRSQIAEAQRLAREFSRRIATGKN